MNSMKSLPVLTFLAVLGALVLAPVSAGVAILAVSVAGIVLILAADYGRGVRPLRAVSAVVPFRAPLGASASFRTAA